MSDNIPTPRQEERRKMGVQPNRDQKTGDQNPDQRKIGNQPNRDQQTDEETLGDNGKANSTRDDL